jgi:Na+/melibiose symporter-like transporter
VVKNLILIGIVITMFLAIILMRNININNKRHKYIILFSPFILACILYLSIFLLTKNMPPDACDGAALLGILFSFILIGVGVLLNLVNIAYLVINNNLGKEGNMKYKK